MGVREQRSDAVGPTATADSSCPVDASSVRPGAVDRASRTGLALLGRLAAGLLRLLGRTWRVEVAGGDPRETEPDSAQLAALFHESMLPCAWLYRDRGYRVAVSRSRDGERIRSVLIALGYGEPARGSSSRGGSAALRGLIRHLEAGTTVAVLVDGPRGPARRAKPGIVSLARLAGRPIQPVAFAARPAVRLGSWDRSLLPLPFARIVVAYGEPLGVRPDAVHGEDEEEALARELDARLAALHEEAEARLAAGG
jgi:lysophospholipid acyltransferase (LPLAT)-like uncharacterized protein